MKTRRAIAFLTRYHTWNQFIKDTKFPEEAQYRVWSEVQAEIGNGIFWKNHLGRSPTQIPLKDFEITDYELYRPILLKDFDSTHSSLTNREVLYWSESSGTTGGRKLFPFTKNYYGPRLRFKSITTIAHLKRNPEYLNKPTLYFTAPSRNQFSPAGIGFGYSSNYHFRRNQVIAGKSTSAIPAEVYRDVDTFLQWGALYAIANDISSIMGMAPARMHAFFKDLPAKLEGYLPYLKGELQLPDGLPALRISKDRLQTIQDALSSSPFKLRKLWPSFRAISTWKASTCSLQIPLLEPYLEPEDVVCDTQYTSTEGTFNVPIDNGVGGPCSIGLMITEFIKIGDKIEKQNLKSAWELEPGQEYEIFLTSQMGLVRYRMYDIVRCNGYFNRIAIIEFLRKSSGQLSLGGGAVIVDEVQIVECIENSGIRFPGSWIIGSNSTGNGLVLYHTGSVAPSSAGKLDEELIKRSKMYSGSLSLGTLIPMKFVPVDRDHKVWSSHVNHAQSKQKIFTTDIFLEPTVSKIAN